MEPESSVNTVDIEYDSKVPEQLIHWTKEDSEQLKSVFSRINKIGQLTFALPLGSQPASDIEAEYQGLALEQQILNKAVEINLSGEHQSGTHSVNHYLQQLVQETGKLYKEADFDERAGYAVELLGMQVDELGKDLLEIPGVLEDHDRSKAAESLSLLSTYIAHGKDPQIKKRAIDYFKQNSHLIEQIVKPNNEGYIFYMYNPLALQLYQIGDPSQKEIARQLVLNILNSKDGPSFFARFENRDQTYHIMHGFEPLLIELLQNEISKYDIDARPIVKPWIRIEGAPGTNSFGDLYTRRNTSIVETLQNLERLRRERPGSPKVLQEMFGINHFGRYPIEILIRQFDEREDYSKPYGVLIGAADDRNEFGRLSYDAFKELFDQLGDKANFRITECDSKYGGRGIGRRLMEFHNRYYREGQGHKIGFLIIHGHGNKAGDRVWLGNADNPFGSDIVDINTLRSKRISGIKDFFVEGLDIITMSCHAAKVFAQELSKMLGARVYGQECAVNRLTKLEASVEKNGHIKIKPAYQVVVSSKDEEAETVVYFAGQRAA